jgi:hypothetical protein
MSQTLNQRYCQDINSNNSKQWKTTCCVNTCQYTKTWIIVTMASRESQASIIISSDQHSKHYIPIKKHPTTSHSPVSRHSIISRVSLKPLSHTTSAKAPYVVFPTSFRSMVPLDIVGTSPQSANLWNYYDNYCNLTNISDKIVFALIDEGNKTQI